MKRPLLIAVTSTALAGLGFVLTLAVLFAYVGSQTREASYVQAIAPSTVVDEPADQPIVSVPVEAPAPKTAPAAAQKTTQTVQEETPVEEPASSPTDAELHMGGVRPEDYAVAREFFFKDGDWNMAVFKTCGCYRYYNPYQGNAKRLSAINYYVLVNYTTWSAAQAQYQAVGSW